MPFGWRGKPHFYGKFVETLDGKVILEGYFGGGFVQRIAGWVSLIIVPTAEIIFILGAFSTGLAIGQRLLMVFFIPGALLIGFTVSKFIERFTSKDIEWISNKVREAL